MSCISAGKSHRNLNQSRHDWRLWLWLLTDNFFEDVDAALQIVLPHYERGKDAQCVFAGGEREQTFVPSALDDLIGRLNHIESPDVARAANCPNFSGAPRDYIELSAKPHSVFTNRFEQRGIREPVNHVARNGCQEGPAAECRAVITRLDRRSDFFRHQNRAHRQPTRERLGERHHVGDDADAFVGEKVPGTSETALNLVEDERYLALLCQSAESAQKISIKHADAAFSLNRLDNDRSNCLFVERDIQVADIPLAD